MDRESSGGPCMLTRADKLLYNSISTVAKFRDNAIFFY